jgi:hypothetical protein
VTNANSKAEVNNPPPNARVQADEKQGFDLPLFAMPGIFRGKLSARQGRKSVEVVSAHNSELWQLAQKVAAEAVEPIEKSFTRVLRKAS